MVREATITQEEVSSVADRIRAAGGKPTALAVREDLGRGSMATVLRLLQTWQAGQDRPPELPVSLPSALQRALLDFIGQEVAAAKVLLAQELATAQQVQKDLIAENEAQASRLDEFKQTLVDMQAEHSQLEGRYAVLQAEAIEAKGLAENQRRAAESARVEIARLQLRLEGLPRLEAEVTRLRESLDAERAARVTSDQAAAVACATFEHSQLLVEDLKVRLTKAETELREASQEARTLRGQVSGLQGALDCTSKELARTQQDARRAEAIAAELTAQLAALTNGRLATSAPKAKPR